MLALCRQNPKTKYKFEATPISIGNVEYSKKQKPYRKCRLNDGRNEEEVDIYQGTGPDLDPKQHEGKPLQFSVEGSPWKDKMFFRGFWDSEAELPASSEPYQAQPQAPQAPQAAQNAPAAGQATLAPPSDYDVKERKRTEGMCRHGIVCAIIQNGGLQAYVDAEENVIEAIVQYDMDGPSGVPF